MKSVLTGRPRNRGRLCFLILLWVSAVCAGLAVALRYEKRPGLQATPPQHWPADSRIEPGAGRATLLLLAHPRCPCTRASLSELALLMTRCQGLVTAHVLLMTPPGMPEGWARTSLWGRAAAIPGVEVGCDPGGVEARRFGSTTSGQTLLYDAEGRLLFSGGITASRGQEGDNAGLESIVALLHGNAAPRATTSVFGCSLVDPPSTVTQGQASTCCHTK